MNVVWALMEGGKKLVPELYKEQPKVNEQDTQKQAIPAVKAYSQYPIRDVIEWI